MDLPEGGNGNGTGSPTSTLVGSSTGLEINLIWDASVQNSATWKSVEAAVVSAAQLYTSMFSNHVVLNIDIGLGEIDGTAMAKGALGESESEGYISSYNTVTTALAGADAALVSSGQLLPPAPSAQVQLTLGRTSSLRAPKPKRSDW